VSFRTRVTLALLALAVVPLLVLGYGVRRETRARLDADATRRVRATADAIDARLSQSFDPIRATLESLGGDLADDNRFRAALAGENAERRWLLDWASSVMLPSRLLVLQLQDSSGRILSSGQFRNDFDRVAPALPRVLESAPSQLAVVDTRTPERLLRALVGMVSFTVRGERFAVIGGVPLDSTRVAALSGDPAVHARLVLDGAVGPEGAIQAASLPYVNDAGDMAASTARIVLLLDATPARVLESSITRWLLTALATTLILALVIGLLLGRFISAPLTELSARTAKLDLDRLDQRFNTGRDDEVGALERTLDSLAARLRTSVARLREAERAAATGDLARQVNHDIKNGLAPIRNVLRHLGQLAEREPAALAATFIERRGTLESSVEYLDALARNYARLSPTLGHGPIDARPVVLDIARAAMSDTTRVDVKLTDPLPAVGIDAVVLKRILDNLVSNAVEALEGKPGTITITGAAVPRGEEKRVRFTVADTGRGMTREELDRAFGDFHTTKPAGTGLGLSVVRRLLTDVGGSVRAETTPGEGTTFTIEIPAA
jgi:signal transduction histidine kinase